jgi:hypothetical protein
VSSEDEIRSVVAELQRRIQLLEDEREIRAVLSRYGFNADLGRADAYVDLFTADGVMDLDPDLIQPSRLVGSEALRTMITRVLVNSFNRWTLVRTDAGWKISECFRRPAGSVDQDKVSIRTIC